MRYASRLRIEAFSQEYNGDATPGYSEVTEVIEGWRGQEYTIWDRIVVKEVEGDLEKGGIELSRAMRKIRKQLSSSGCGEDDDGGEEGGRPDIASVSFGPYLLYANFLNEGDKVMLRKPLLELIQEAIVSQDVNIEDFDDDDDDEEVSVGEINLKDLTKSQLEEIEHLKGSSYFELDVLVEDTETGEEVELPPVRMVRRTRK